MPRKDRDDNGRYSADIGLNPPSSNKGRTCPFPFLRNPRQNTLAAFAIVKQPSLRHGHTCRVPMRIASAFEVQDASSGQIRQMAGSAASARSLAHAEAPAHRPENRESIAGKHDARIKRVRASFARPKGRTLL
ncbi:hypothetical protein J2W92_004084 [Rhizobium leguminosarum]